MLLNYVKDGKMGVAVKAEPSILNYTYSLKSFQGRKTIICRMYKMGVAVKAEPSIWNRAKMF